ncbi:co-chaperone DjlA [Alteromonas sp. 5E99-2]|uniref:co-chaperone DjlA n=1 Tax=Alteromonas sp. 5E99-2 TaxID=2817683 RepID=UPI001A992D62|nr:co-chaperone DjlA [Alteromonas sp. 5E99-2]MBO1254320.1 co-chaperone DjlA [Alteromonas sp. 5E99-2]
MLFWGKLLGFVFGFMALKVPGAIIGLVIGHYFDRSYGQSFARSGGFARFFTDPESFQKNAVFFHSLFAVLGHIAKADGRVTQAEIAVATHLMDTLNLSGDARKEAQTAFNEGKASDFPLNMSLKDLFASCHGRRDLLQMFLEIVIQAALSDGTLSSAEYVVLEKTAKQLRFSKRELDFLISAHKAQQRFQQERTGSNKNAAPEQSSIDDAYKILGLQKNADEKTIKRAYKKQMSEHHPDKLAAKGLPAEAMEMAKQKTQAIQAAYEMIKSSLK